MKKALPLIMILAACLSPPCQVNAAGGGWSAEYIEPEVSAKPINKQTEFIEITSLAADGHYSGEQSAVCHIKFARSQQANTYLCMENSLSEALDEGKTYDFSFYAKGTFENKGIYVGIGTDENLTYGGMVTLLNKQRYSAEDIGNGWKKYTFCDIAYNGSGSLFRIKAVQLCTDIYIDDVVLTEHGGGDDLIIDGGFEGSDVTETEDASNSDEYTPKNLIATERAGHIMLSWINPKKSKLSKVSVYDITGGTETFLTNELSTASDSYVNYDVKALTEGETYLFKVVCEFGGDIVTESVISGVASEKRPQSFMAVALNGNNPGTVYIERNDTHSPGGALRVISNKQDWSSNNYIQADTSNVSFKDTEEYEVSVWMKGYRSSPINEAGFKFTDLLRPGWGRFKEARIEAEEDGWLNVVFKAEEIGTSPIMVLAECRTDLLVDDIEVWQMKDGERSKLIFSQNFDSEDRTVDDITDASAEVGRSSVKINWNASSEADRVRVYVKDGEELSQRAELYTAIGSVEFTRLKNDYIYNYVIKAVDEYNNESGGVEISASPTPEDYECYEYGIYRGGTALDAIDAAGTYKVKAVMKNNKLDEGLNAQVIAVLRRDGKRVDAAASEIESVSKSGYDEPGTDIQAQITVGDLSEGEYELSVYLWDGLGNMKILAPCKVFREQAE